MCDQCTTEAISYGEPLPGWYLMRAQKEGYRWHAGEWGLVECNDPTFTWSATPTPDPTWGMTDHEEERWFDTADPKSPEYARASLRDSEAVDFYTVFKSCSPETGYWLIKAAMERGYDPDKSGGFEYWLFSYLGEWLKTAVSLPHHADA